MHPVFSINKVLSVLLVFSVILSSGCHRKTDSLTLGEWIHELCSKAGISDFSQSDPYFMNILSDSEYFNDVQSAVEWGVLDPDYGFDPDQQLTRAWTAGTLMNLAGKKQDTDTGIRDISGNPFQEQIQAAVSAGFMKTDKRNMFRPDEVIDPANAEKLLEKTVAYINSRKITDTVNDIEWKNPENIQEITPDSFDGNTLRAVLPEETTIQPGMVLHWKNPDTGEEKWYQAESIEGNEVILKEPDFMHLTESMDLEGSTDIDFSNAEITDPEGNIIRGSTVESEGISLMAFQPQRYSKSFTVSGFTVNLKAVSTGISADISRKLKAGTMTASTKITGVHCDYTWKSRKEDIRDAYFKVKFSSEESLSLTGGSYRNLYGDFSKIKADSFIPSLRNMWMEKNDIVEGTFTIAKIRVPVPEAPLLNLTLNLEIHINAEGKAELVLTQSNEAGCEVRNGKLRIIKNSSSRANAGIRSSASVTAGIRFGLNAATVTLTDAGINAGAKAIAKTTAHLYDSSGKHQKVSTDIPTDVADEMSDGNGDVLICGDVNAYWILNVRLNSSSSILGKYGISGKADLLDQKNASLLPKGKRHIENFHFVDHCTRGERIVQPSHDTIHVAGRITLDHYSFALDAGTTKTIRITGLPEGYRRSDLLYLSEHPETASVDASGTVTAHTGGSTKITIQTSDNRYSSYCSVLVPQVNR